MSSIGTLSRREFLQRVASLFVTLPAVQADVPLLATMVHEPTLLEQIVANPDDDSPRLAYADWLTRRGNPMGEMIRLQCLTARLDDTHPEWFALNFRLPNVLHGSNPFTSFLDHVDNASAWATEIQDAVTTRRKSLAIGTATFERGMIENFTFGSYQKFLDVQADLFEAAPLLREIEFFEVKDPDRIAAFLRCENLNRVKSLTFYGCVLDAEGMRLLCDSPNLCKVEALHFTDCKLADRGISHLADSNLVAQLTKLCFEWCEFGKTATSAPDSSVFQSEALKPLAFSRREGRLRFLEVDGLTGEDARGIANSPLFSALEALELRNCQLTGSDWSCLLNAPFSQGLKRLSSIRTCPDGSFPMVVAGQQPLVSLSCIEQLDSDSVKQFTNTVPHGLLRLDLRGNRIGDDGIRAISSCRNLASLKYLHVGENGISASGARAIADSNSLQSLLSLKLAGNPVGADGAKALANSGAIRSLRFLDLCATGAGDEGALAVATSLHLTALNWLNLDDNGIGPDGVQALIASVHLGDLVALRIRRNPVGEESMNCLRARFGSDAVDSYWLGYLI